MRTTKQVQPPSDNSRRSPLDTGSQHLQPPTTTRRVPGAAISRAIRLCAVATAVAVLILTVATSAAATAGGGGAFGARLAPISAASAFALPPASQCLSHNALTIQLRRLPHVKWMSAIIKINGARFKTVKRSQVNSPIRLVGLPAGRVAVSITAKTNTGRSVTATRTYETCPPARKPTAPVSPVVPVKPGSPSPTTPAPPTPAPTTPTPSPLAPTPLAPSGPAPGGYVNSGLSFFVSPDSSQVQDVVVNPTTLSCSDGTTMNSEITIKEIAIESDTTFSGHETQSGLISGKAVTITYAFSGEFVGSNASGTYREDIAFEDGSGKTCTTNTRSWSAGIVTQGSQVAAPPKAGGYVNSGLSFFVSPDSSQVQDVVVDPTTLSCSDGTTMNSEITIKEIAIESDTTFSGHETQSGLISGKPVTITYTFRGHFHGLDSGGNQRVDGAYREDIAFEDGSGKPAPPTPGPGRQGSSPRAARWRRRRRPAATSTPGCRSSSRPTAARCRTSWSTPRR